MARRHDIPTLERRGHTFCWRARVPVRFRRMPRQARLSFSLRLSDHRKAIYMAQRLNTLLADLTVRPTAAMTTKDQLEQIFRAEIERMNTYLEDIAFAARRAGTTDDVREMEADLEVGWAYRQGGRQHAGSNFAQTVSVEIGGERALHVDDEGGTIAPVHGDEVRRIGRLRLRVGIEGQSDERPRSVMRNRFKGGRRYRKPDAAAEDDEIGVRRSDRDHRVLKQLALMERDRADEGRDRDVATEDRVRARYGGSDLSDCLLDERLKVGCDGVGIEAAGIGARQVRRCRRPVRTV
ncbi:DUF6538 domain-containing protein [Fulvimarina sp. 2208YS6-2-32]|uniref:DUF6538 domain-containing protein n=1 Tax=Fulvimarina uroteuthidis TaxID=3098149 RepID=A0ABU5I0U7_9HYPH|nr:DUF6538 domain-containing protein [Fulvimarina sp. 2208YS6-2-32]MDY8108747.1 DUF6538 domain-containing protein [Fulvimarina sp. 2208YS6-2-32]